MHVLYKFIIVPTVVVPAFHLGFTPLAARAPHGWSGRVCPLLREDRYTNRRPQWFVK